MTPEKLDSLEVSIAAAFPALKRDRLPDALVLWVSPQQLVETMVRLRDDAAFDFKQMIDLAGVHFPDRNPPFQLVWQLLSVYKNHRLRVKMALSDETPVPSLAEVWRCANWYEREAYEMFGIFFTGHPDLRRLLTEYDFDGYPMRKDFPIEGRTEVRYDPEKRRVIQHPVSLKRKNREYYG